MQPPAEAVVASATSAIGAVTFAQFDLGLPLPEVMAAFAGASLILSFLPPRVTDDNKIMHKWRTLCTIGFCTFMGALLGPWLLSLIVDEGSKLAPMGAAFATAALGQVFIPMMIEKRETITKALMKKLGLGD